MHVRVGKGPRTPTLLSDLSRGEKALPEQPVCGAVGLTAFELCHFAKKILNVVFIVTCHSSWVVSAMQVFWSPQSAFDLSRFKYKNQEFLLATSCD